MGKKDQKKIDKLVSLIQWRIDQLDPGEGFFAGTPIGEVVAAVLPTEVFNKLVADFNQLGAEAVDLAERLGNSQRLLIEGRELIQDALVEIEEFFFGVSCDE